MAIQRKTPLYIFLSVLTGAACSIIIFFLFIAASMGLGLFEWSDGGDKEYLNTLERTTNISVVVSVAAAIAGGIFIVYKHE